MKTRSLVRVLVVLLVVVAATVTFEALNTAAKAHCAKGIKPCSANQVGESCDPNNPGLVCSAQADGAYCCLAYAP
jgi:hypothetical protein